MKAMNVIALIAIALIATVLSIILKQYKPEYGMFISLIVGVIILGVVIASIEPILATMQNLLSKLNVANEFSQTLIKSLGICYVTQLACDSCRDAGETAIASKLELGGKIAILIIALPMFTKLSEIVLGLINI